jgi:hypothetical protein
MQKQPYELLIRFNLDGTIGAHYQEALVDDGKVLAVLDPEAIEGLKKRPEVLAAVQALLPGIIEAAEKHEKLAELETLKGQQTETASETEALQADCDELIEILEAL